MMIVSAVSLIPLDYWIWDILQDLVYEGRRLPFPNLPDLKEAIKYKWKDVTIETVRKSIEQRKKTTDYWTQLGSRMEALLAHFPLIAVTRYRSHAVRRVELIGYFVRFAYFTVKTKA